jgi:hypothetical protein
LKWLGTGIAIGALMLTAFVLLINLTDDGRPPRKANRPSAMNDALSGAVPSPVAAANSVASASVGPSKNDFELPDDAPSAQSEGAHTPTAKARLAARPAPKAKSSARTAP